MHPADPADWKSDLYQELRQLEFAIAQSPPEKQKDLARQGLRRIEAMGPKAKELEEDPQFMQIRGKLENIVNSR